MLCPRTTLLSFTPSFEQNVLFFGGAGSLELAQSQAYSGTIRGFSSGGGTSLDLRDAGFVSAGEASFSGTFTRGVLTVSDGTHTARINLIGDDASASFVASSDGAGGTLVVAQAGAAAPIHSLLAAAASLGSGAPASSPGRPSGGHRRQSLEAHGRPRAEDWLGPTERAGAPSARCHSALSRNATPPSSTSAEGCFLLFGVSREPELSGGRADILYKVRKRIRDPVQRFALGSRLVGKIPSLDPEGIASRCIGLPTANAPEGLRPRADRQWGRQGSR